MKGEEAGILLAMLLTPFSSLSPSLCAAVSSAPGPFLPLPPSVVLLVDLILYQAVLARLEIRVVHAIRVDEFLILGPLFLALRHVALGRGVLQHLGNVLLLQREGRERGWRGECTWPS